MTLTQNLKPGHNTNPNSKPKPHPVMSDCYIQAHNPKLAVYMAGRVYSHFLQVGLITGSKRTCH